MAVVKNLMVRFGSDVSNLIRGMKTAESSTVKSTASIRKSTSGMRKSVKEAFSDSRMSVREYSAYVAKTRQDHAVAVQGAQRLRDQIQQMESEYQTIQSVAEKFDIAKSLGQQLKDLNEALKKSNDRLRGFRAEQKDLRAELNSFQHKKGNSLEYGEKVYREARVSGYINEEEKKVDAIAEKIENINDLIQSVGDIDINLVSLDELEKLKENIQRAKNELNATQTVADETKEKLKSIGVGVSAGQLLREEYVKTKAAIKDACAAISEVVQHDPNPAMADGIFRIGRSLKMIPVNALRHVTQHLTRMAVRIRSIPEIPGRIWNGIKNIGATAAQAVGGGVRRLGNALKSLGGSAMQGIAAIPGRLLHIGRSAASGTGGLNRMVRSIRNIGVVSLGLRVASGMFGRMRSVISSYISQNEALNASVTSMKNQLGQALTPAINLVLAAMQRLMPVVTAVSNGINSVFSALFGDIKTTTAAVGAAAASLEIYGFDQITKTSDESGSTGSTAIDQTGEQSALVQKLTGWIRQLKEAFTAGDWAGLGSLIGGGINSALDAIDAVDVGSRAGRFADNVATALHSALSTTDFAGIGAKLGQMVTAGCEAFDWRRAGDAVGKGITAIPSIVVGFLLQTDWGIVGESLSQLLSGCFYSVGSWLQSVNWIDLGDSLWRMVTGIDYAEIASGLFTMLGSAIGAGVGILFGFIGNALSTVGSYFQQKIQEAGGNVVLGLLKGITDALVNIGTWIVDHIVTPFVDGFKKAFGIHSPSTVMQEQGGFLIKGLFKGIVDNWTSVTSFFGTALSDLKSALSNGWDKIKEGASSAWSKVKDAITGNSSDAQRTTKSNWQDMERTAASTAGRIAGSVESKWTTIKQRIGESLSKARESADGSWAGMLTASVNAGSNILSAVITDWSAARGHITENTASARSSAAEIWEGITADAEKAASGISGKALRGFTALKDGIVNTFQDIWTGIKGWINTLIGGVEDMVNFIIRGINGLIGGLGTISSLGKRFGVNLSIKRISTVSLPRLASGAVVSGPTVALVGEAGKEAVVPLERNTEWMAKLAQELTAQGGGTSGARVTIPIYLGGRKVTEYVIRDINQIIKTTGVCPIHV